MLRTVNGGPQHLRALQRSRCASVAFALQFEYTVGMTDVRSDITLLLKRWQRGDADAESQLMACLYPLLHRLAVQRLRRSGAMTWQPTELVNEIYVKLFEEQRVSYANRTHFLAIAARVMRRVVADHFRERAASKRGGDVAIVSLDEAGDAAMAATTIDFVDLNRLLDELEQIDLRSAEVIELRYFAGLSVPETSVAMNLSERTVKRTWQFARAWLHNRLAESGAG